MTDHTVSRKVVTRSDPSTGERRQYHKLTCSCGAYLGETDSRSAADTLSEAHTSTPECPTCHHRNEHNLGKDSVVCSYRKEPTHDGLKKEYEVCFCGVPGLNVATGGVVDDAYVVGETDACVTPMGVLGCRVCSHKRHGSKPCKVSNCICHKFCDLCGHPDHSERSDKRGQACMAELTETGMYCKCGDTWST